MIGGLTKYISTLFENLGTKPRVLIGSGCLSGSPGGLTDLDSQVQQTKPDETDRSRLFRNRVNGLLSCPVWSLNVGEDLRVRSKRSING